MKPAPGRPALVRRKGVVKPAPVVAGRPAS